MERIKIFAGNWKMNNGPVEAMRYFEQLEAALTKPHALDIKPDCRRVIFPQAFCLTDGVIRVASKCNVEIGAQNVHFEEKGAFTGELSATVLKQIGINWTLIAHSERRQLFGETDETAAKRMKRAIWSGLNVIYCVGETLSERESAKTEAVLKKQVDAFILGFRESLIREEQIICIAYEPVWAIGTGMTALPEQAEQAHAFIRKTLGSGISVEVAQKTSILYGGSVTAENAGQILSMPNVDGVLAGGASLKADQFAKILCTTKR